MGMAVAGMTLVWTVCRTHMPTDWDIVSGLTLGHCQMGRLPAKKTDVSYRDVCVCVCVHLFFIQTLSSFCSSDHLLTGWMCV